MALLRKSEIMEMSEKDMLEKLLEIRKELLTEYSKLSAGGVAENSGKMGEMKKIIARIKTIGGFKGYNING